MSYLGDQFSRFRSWIMSKIPTRDIYKAFGLPPSKEVENRTELWRNLYQGKPPWNGKSLGLPAIVCWDIAKKAIGELKLSASRATQSDDFTKDVLDSLIRPELRSQVEYALAMGAVIARPYYDGEVKIGWYTADSILPTRWKGRKMTGVVLLDRLQKGRHFYTKVESIQPTLTGWSIMTKAFKNTANDGLGAEVSLTDVGEWADITPIVEIEGSVSPFAYMGTPWANNLDINSAMGTSIYKDATTALEELDRVYTTLSWEVESGQAAVFVDDSMIEVDPRTLTDKLGSLERKLYRKLSSTKGDDLLEPYSPPLRIQQLNEALRTQLTLVCMACHLDAGAYIYDQQAMAVTATEVRTRQQQTYGTIVDIQQHMIEPFVYDVVDSIRMIQGLYEIEEIPEDIEIGIDFGDSILVDEQLDRANAQTEVATGLRSKLSYLMEYRMMTEAEAEAEVARIKAETPVIDFFGNA